MTDLTEKQKAFCREYIRDWNGKRAAEAAGYSENSAKEIASQNLTKENVKAYIEELKGDLEKTVGISKSMVLYHLKQIEKMQLTARSPDDTTKAHRQHILFLIEKAIKQR